MKKGCRSLGRLVPGAVVLFINEPYPLFPNAVAAGRYKRLHIIATAMPTSTHSRPNKKTDARLPSICLPSSIKPLKWLM